MDHRYCAENSDILLRPIKEKDIEYLRIWRNDATLSTYLSKIPFITPEMQIKWYKHYLKDHNTFFFSVVDKGRCVVIGSVALYGFKDSSCEVGRIIIGDSTSRGKGIGYSSLLLAIGIGIEKFQINEFRLNVHENNIAAKKIYEKAGFQTYGRHHFSEGGFELEMLIQSDEFYLKNPEAKLNKIFMEDEMKKNIRGGGYYHSQINIGENTIVAPSAILEHGVTLGHNCIVEDDVKICEGTHIDSNTIIRKGTTIGNNSFIGSNCIIGEYQSDYILTRDRENYRLKIGSNCLVRSGSIIYSNSVIGENLQTGHQVTIREKSVIGNHVSVGTLSDIQGLCQIGNYVRLHSNVHISQYSKIEDYVWIFPYVVLTNDPTPPSEKLIGVYIHSFAIVATGSILLPGVEIGQDALIGAGAIVTKNVVEYKVAVGNPAREISDVRKIKNKVTGEPAYPWRYHYSHNMPWEGVTFDAWYKALVDEEGQMLFHMSDDSEVQA